MLNLNSETFRDKVYGCWLGKNCGGTLGAPLEQAYGQPEPFDIWWYPELREGGIPNDDLEMQLIWLKALEEVGPGLKAADLAQYWLDHIGYNWDEYGLSKTNLHLGLIPPVSGIYNNWFKDCMGCPIRSEIWACLAPGLPSIAVRYAYEDAICDHAGGESVYGELFNTAIESAAFVLSDREKLLDIGLSYVPASSQTARAIRAARQAYEEGLDWKAARRRVLEATPHYNAQYSPINMGFQVIGWQYGEDFGDAICKAVNCGYDTDCTGATLGSVLGIIAGRSGLPTKWTQPLGEEISTNESWGGLTHASDGANPVPTTLTELTDRVIIQARHVLAEYNAVDTQGNVHFSQENLYANDKTYTLEHKNPWRIDYKNGTVEVGVEYDRTAAILPGEHKRIITHLTNLHPQALTVSSELQVPTSWTAEPVQQSIELPAHGTLALEWEIQALRVLENSNRLSLTVTASGRPAQPAVPIVLIGANHYRISEIYTGDGSGERELFEQPLVPEHVRGDILTMDGRAGIWDNIYSRDNALPLHEVAHKSGAVYLQTYIWNEVEQQPGWFGAAVNCPVKMWVNGELKVENFAYQPIRPNNGGNDRLYSKVTLKQGWNEILLKLVRSATATPFEGHLLLSNGDPDKHYEGLWQVGRTRTPWDI